MIRRSHQRCPSLRRLPRHIPVLLMFAAGACGLSGCAERERPVVQSSAESRREIRATGPMEVSVEIARQFSVVVIDSRGPLPAERVTSAILSRLASRGLAVSSDSRPDENDLVVLIRSDTRVGAVWGGVPTREVLLEYRLFDARQAEPLAEGAGVARFAERSADEALAGALNKASDILVRKLIRSVVMLPEAFRSAPPAVAQLPEGMPTLACIPFHNASGRADLDGWCKTLASLGAAAFQRSGRFEIKERARLKDLVADQDVVAVLGGQSDAARRVGTDLGVSRLLVGEVALRPDGVLVVTARLLRVDDAGVEHVIVVADSPTQVARLEAEFQRQLDRPMPGWIAKQLERASASPLEWPADSRGPG